MLVTAENSGDERRAFFIIDKVQLGAFLDEMSDYFQLATRHGTMERRLA